MISVCSSEAKVYLGNVFKWLMTHGTKVGTSAKTKKRDYISSLTITLTCCMKRGVRMGNVCTCPRFTCPSSSILRLLIILGVRSTPTKPEMDISATQHICLNVIQNLYLHMAMSMHTCSIYTSNAKR
mmetsp:Transcript_3687/g.4699  ORF Transcript_3687/g.4699 Transcript_3687/m.4699 type:complete len:127 (-) Transcript_3687:1624-2004(-)